YRWLELLGLAIVSIAIHPKFLNPLIQLATQMKAKAKGFATVDVGALQMKRYPLLPLLGEMGFLSLRGFGFLCTWLALKPVPPSQVFLLLGAFCVAWLLGLVVPGAPGGVGVFETSAIALLDDSFSPGLILSVVALYRLVSILAEAIGAGLIWLDSRLIAHR
ncbi:flippase-like domain-containing protein, partial [Planktothrix sp. FACHB-1355]|nr:flippase-like domain-containing protein [Planktothrix sp. FACHB-1355]